MAGCVDGADHVIEGALLAYLVQRWPDAEPDFMPADIPSPPDLHESHLRRGMSQPPSVGRIVHYVSYGTPGGEYTSQCRAAIITEVGEANRAGLAVLNPTGMFFDQGCIYDPGDVADEVGYMGGTWHWPERV